MNQELIRMNCPACQKRLKTRKPVSTGKSITCPGCGNAFAYQPAEEPLVVAETMSPANRQSRMERTTEAAQEGRMSKGNRQLVAVSSAVGTAVLCLSWMLFSTLNSGANRDSNQEIVQASPASSQNAGNDAMAGTSEPIGKAGDPEVPQTKPQETGESSRPETPRQKMSSGQQRLNQIFGSTDNANLLGHLEQYRADGMEQDDSTRENAQPTGAAEQNDSSRESLPGDDATFSPTSPAPKQPSFDTDADAPQDPAADFGGWDRDPDFCPDGGLQGNLGGVGPAPAPKTVIKEVPVFIPVVRNSTSQSRKKAAGQTGNTPSSSGTPNNSGSNAAGGSNSTGPAASPTPAVNVIVTLVDRTSPIMTIDFQSNPGVSAQLSVTLDSTPSTPVSVTFAPPTGLAVSQTSLTFPANVAPAPQIVTVSGNGQLPMSGPTRVVNLNVSAVGGGLRSGQPAAIPVQVLRRNRWVSPATGTVFTRNDTTAAGGSPQSWTASFGVPLSGNTANYYTRDYVELLNPRGLKIRVYANRMDIETALGSGAFFSNFLTGTWQ